MDTQHKDRWVWLLTLGMVAAVACTARSAGNWLVNGDFSQDLHGWEFVDNCQTSFGFSRAWVEDGKAWVHSNRVGNGRQSYLIQYLPQPIRPTRFRVDYQEVQGHTCGSIYMGVLQPGTDVFWGLLHLGIGGNDRERNYASLHALQRQHHHMFAANDRSLELGTFEVTFDYQSLTATAAIICASGTHTWTFPLPSADSTLTDAVYVGAINNCYDGRNDYKGWFDNVVLEGFVPGGGGGGGGDIPGGKIAFHSNRGGNHQLYWMLVALGFRESDHHPTGLIQLHDPYRSRNARKALLATAELVPTALMPYPQLPISWAADALYTIPSDPTDDLMVVAYDVGFFPVGLIRFRYDDGELKRLGAYYHAGTVGHSRPIGLEGKTMVFFRGNRNTTIPDGMPGQYLYVAGSLDLDKLIEPRQWQDRGGRTYIQGRTLSLGVEESYVFLAPIPGLDPPHWGLNKYESPTGQPDDGYYVVECNWRRFRLYADGGVDFQLVVDMPPAYKDLETLIPELMDGVENQIIEIPLFEGDPEASFAEWLEQWYRDTYRPAAEVWERLVEAKIETGTLTGEFVDKFRADMTRMREAEASGD